MWLLRGERRRKSAAACSAAGQRRSVVLGAGPNWTLCHLGSTADGLSAVTATAALTPRLLPLRQHLNSKIHLKKDLNLESVHN